MKAQKARVTDGKAPVRLRLLPLGAVLVPIVMLAGGGWLSWRDTWERARAEMAQVASAVAEYGARTLEGHAVGVARVNDHLRGINDSAMRDNEAQLSTEVARIIADLPQAALASVIGADSIVRLATNFTAVPPNSVADRAYFRALSMPGAPSVFVMPLFTGRLDNRQLFSVARRRTGSGNPPGPDGFEGVVHLSVLHGVASNSLRLIQHERTDRLAIVTPSGQVVMDSGSLTSPDAPQLIDPDMTSMLVDGARIAEAQLPDGSLVLVATRPVEGFGVLAVAMRPRVAIVRNWREGMAGYLIFGVPATLMLLWFSLMLRRDQLRQDRFAAGLASDVQEGVDRLSRSRRFGLIGTFEHDLRSGISRRSPEYMAVHGLVPTAAEEGPANWMGRLHPDDRERAEAHLLDSLSAESAATEYGQTYRIQNAEGEVRWIAARAEIKRDAAGHAVALRGAHVDVTPLRTTELALAESDARLRLAQQAVGIGTFEWWPGPRRITWSHTLIRLWGFDPALGQPDLALAQARVHREDRPILRRQLAAASLKGQLRVEFRVLRPTADGGTETVWLAAIGEKLVQGGLEDGEDQIMGVAYDITERKRAEQHTSLLAHEVEHRAKNVLAVVGGLVRVTTADTLEAYVEALEGRISALARTMSLLSEKSWVGADLRTLLRNELLPFDNGNARVSLDGPALTVAPDIAQMLSLILHELATNAVKYGALSVADGRLELRWEQRDVMVVLQWYELGGPAIAEPPTRGGFGSALIQQSLSGHGGSAMLEWRREGLAATLRFPA